MSRRLTCFLLPLPALALIVWLVATQLPLWTAPQPDWFAAATPGVCAAVRSLVLSDAARSDPNAGIGAAAAQSAAAQVVSEHYGITALEVGAPLAVQAVLPGTDRRAYFVVTARLSDDTLPKAAVIYLDAASGELRALFTTPDDPAQNCAFDVRGALLAALRSPPLLLLVVYVLAAGGVLVGVLVVQRLRGRH